MDQEVLKTHLLSITAAGSLIMLFGAILYLFRDEVSGYARFFLPIPPLGVAAYIFVFNMFSHYGGTLPQGTWNTANEILYSVAFTANTFGLFTLLLIVIINYLKR
jgi:membrane associated rhomboid family serine protease